MPVAKRRHCMAPESIRTITLKRGQKRNHHQPKKLCKPLVLEDQPNTVRNLLMRIIHMNSLSESNPSHVNIQGNEIADALVKACADDASVPSAPLTYLELL
ncbi:hypothetical protein AVEN_268035-1 [Araneus ventricosus]|uniref:RNase H type-1 domain-containing protein n=1 Tax=Araneus ventricosus TaxID=182803 RepID=A0A4Y2KD57_ARAVE|nr:hypothetical protein AVEN_268035-1 [Araneus ventricosus]